MALARDVSAALPERRASGSGRVKAAAPVRIDAPRRRDRLEVAERQLRSGPGAGVALLVVIAALALV